MITNGNTPTIFIPPRKDILGRRLRKRSPKTADEFGIVLDCSLVPAEGGLPLSFGAWHFLVHRDDNRPVTWLLPTHPDDKDVGYELDFVLSDVNSEEASSIMGSYSELGKLVGLRTSSKGTS
jgi:hypothetical protein